MVTDGNTELEITFKLDFTNVFLESSFNSFRNIVANFQVMIAYPLTFFSDLFIRMIFCFINIRRGRIVQMYSYNLDINFIKFL